MGEEHNAADLDLPPLRGFDFDFRHTEGDSEALQSDVLKFEQKSRTHELLMVS